IPPWMQMYFDRLQEKTGKSAAALFPHLSVIVHGGVNFAPYRDRLFKTIGKEIATIETYPASEGFIAFQDSQQEEGLWLNTNSGIFFEFIPAAEIFSDRPTRLTLNEVKLGEQYVLIINSNAGLWGYNIGDTVKFVSLKPYRIVVTGRVKHFISAFGEHVIGEEVEYSLLRAAEQQGLRITEFTVAPYIESGKGKSYHEWFIEFEQQPEHLDTLAEQVDRFLQEKNIYYKDLIQGHILLPLRISPVQKNGFIEYMKSQGKLGGQNKVPRLSNDRKIVSGLEKFVLR
ncbi:MAG: GH3 auxin-responsive promoter family protein, partial [Chitinophagaceae bacterium]